MFSGNSCSFLPALLKEHGDRVRASVYRSPELKEYLAWIHPVLPYIMELHHMKMYAFDDNIIVGRYEKFLTTKWISKHCFCPY